MRKVVISMRIAIGKKPRMTYKLIFHNVSLQVMLRRFQTFYSTSSIYYFVQLRSVCVSDSVLAKLIHINCFLAAHVFIDDGMEKKGNVFLCNRFVKQLVDVIELAAT